MKNWEIIVRDGQWEFHVHYPEAVVFGTPGDIGRLSKYVAALEAEACGEPEERYNHGKED